MEPKPFEVCQLEPVSSCLTEFHVGRFDGSQMHRSLDSERETQALLRPPHARLLLLLTSVWRNFQRRRLLRRALSICRRFVDPRQVVWRFLLGEAPAWLMRRAIEESAANEDMLLLGAPDELAYSHIGDAYELHQANPELTKIILAIRLLLENLSFEYLLVADDDSFVNIPTAMELLDLLPKERVYVGNMIDTVPQRWDEQRAQVRAEYSVNLYLSQPSKVPIFAHGMGFVVSQDVAKLLGDVGLSLKSRGNDDMLIGLWLRSVEHLYFLHYWPMFMDHEEYGSPFSRPCDVTSVVVHRMTPERWRNFVPSECHLCGPASQPLDTADDPPARPPPKQVAPATPATASCLLPEQLACAWRPSSDVLAAGEAACQEACRSESRVNSSRVVCPPALCTALCQRPGPRNSLCPELPPRRFARRPRPRPPQLAVCIFGSAWADFGRRARLRAALRSCTAQRLGSSGAHFVFMMGPLPDTGDPLRSPAAREVLLRKDLAILRPLSAVRGSEVNSSKATYAYAEAWRVVEERFGGADFLLFLDHRSFVNVPFLLHAILPQLPTERIYLGCLMEEKLFGACSGTGNSRCDYLWRRRTPLFAHGMGFLVSKDVAQFVSKMASRVVLRSNDVPADAAFGMWVQPLEDLIYESAHANFHEWPPDGSTDREAAGGDLGLSQDITGSSVVVFPMTTQRWKWFNPQTCSLEPPWLVAGARPAGDAAPAPARPPAGAPIAPHIEPEDCWQGMGGRPEAWYLVCCEMHWPNCWGEEFTEEVCCTRPPRTPEVPEPSQPAGNATAGVEALRHFLGFTPIEMERLFAGLGNASLLLPTAGESDPWAAPSAAPAAAPVPAPPVEAPAKRFPCLAPRDCAREAFAKLYQQLWKYGLLPLRHPWITDPQDHLFGLAVKLRHENDGWCPKGHEHTFERIQVAHWLEVTAGMIKPEEVPAERTPEGVPGEKRCLEWDSTEYSRLYFGKHCTIMDVLAYDGNGNSASTGATGNRRFLVDIHTADDTIPANSTGVIVCTQVFEHLQRPHIAMAQLFRLLAPGGFVVWSAPMFSELHGAPQDFYRFTVHGATTVAWDAGFRILSTYTPGGLRETAGYILGITGPYWERNELLLDTNSRWPLQVYMLLQKPP